MNIFVTTFESVIVLLGIGFLGFWVIRKKLIPGNIIGLLSPLALDIALPSFIFVNIIQNFNPGEASDWWTLPLCEWQNLIFLQQMQIFPLFHPSMTNLLLYRKDTDVIGKIS